MANEHNGQSKGAVDVAKAVCRSRLNESDVKKAAQRTIGWIGLRFSAV